MKDTDSKISNVVGYVLKIIKNKKSINTFKTEFNAIKHGDYDKFINLIEEPVSPMVVYDNGTIEKNITSVKNKCDFIGMIGAGVSLDKFYKNCFSNYGNIIDSDFDDELYRKLAMFEIRIRMHVNKNNLITNDDRLETIINKLPTIFQLTKEEIKILHDGRIFLNKIKHHKITNMKWKSNINLFENAYKVLDKHKITVF